MTMWIHYRWKYTYNPELFQLKVGDYYRNNFYNFSLLNNAYLMNQKSIRIVFPKSTIKPGRQIQILCRASVNTNHCRDKHLILKGDEEITGRLEDWRTGMDGSRGKSSWRNRGVQSKYWMMHRERASDGSPRISASSPPTSSPAQLSSSLEKVNPLFSESTIA